MQHLSTHRGSVRSLLFINHIGGSVASAAVNLPQTFLQTYPYLVQYGGAAKAGMRVSRAMKDAIGTVTDRALDVALAQAETDGVIKPQVVFQLQAEASRSLGSNALARAALTTWRSLFRLAEQYNRHFAFIAAWRTPTEEGRPVPLRRGRGGRHAGGLQQGNRPNIAHGAAGATIMTFRQSLMQYVEFLSPLPLRHRALALAVIVLLAGVRGIPFWEDLEDLVDTLAQSMGYNWQSRDQMKRSLVGKLGAGFADFLQRGVSGIAGMPVDISARMGMANIVPATDLLMPSNTNRLDSFLETFGVAGGYVRDALKGELWPVALRNAAAARGNHAAGNAGCATHQRQWQEDSVQVRGLAAASDVRPGRVATLWSWRGAKALNVASIGSGIIVLPARLHAKPSCGPCRTRVR